ncbi:MAG: 50S ribosomal protein L24 [Bacteroidales bacterium]|jgi:large subunit ribosomal protein L24|nr:50S ribosomal protein L24 [Bacteroidales bacterium]MCK4360911.1 50S ribosomal protein L24 [Bacteroidales bacterium]MCK4407612.1 50S ribosomal protein L24 [Bacteroidales bacterium]
MRTKLHIKKGDTVMVIAGNSKGQQGRVLKINASDNKAIVEGINMISKHTKPNADNPKGGILKRESPIHLSNLMVIDSSGKPTRIGRKLDEKQNKSIRYSKKTAEVVK